MGLPYWETTRSQSPSTPVLTTSRRDRQLRTRSIGPLTGVSRISISRKWQRFPGYGMFRSDLRTNLPRPSSRDGNCPVSVPFEAVSHSRSIAVQTIPYQELVRIGLV